MQFHVRAGYVGAGFRLWKALDGEQGFQFLHDHLHLFYFVGKDLQFGKGTYHGKRKHDSQCCLRCSNGSFGCQGKACRKGSQQGSGEQGKCQLHGNPGGREPFDNESTVIRNCLGIFFVGNTGTPKSLDNFNTFYVLYNRAVHIGVGFIVGIEVLSTDLEGQCHTYQGGWKSY